MQEIIKAKFKPIGLISTLAVALAVIGALGQTAPNAVQAENARPGTNAWLITHPASAADQIEGYASASSVNRGGQVTFYVNTADPSYSLQVFRLGYYGGLGGRAETASITLPGSLQTVPAPDPTTGIIDCNWTPAYALTTSNPGDSTDWVSGMYVALLTGTQSGLQTYISFTVRDDSRNSALLF